jgi:hypothetical protein
MLGNCRVTTQLVDTRVVLNCTELVSPYDFEYGMDHAKLHILDV